jgi:trans-aconitate methyltransferase
MVAVMYTRTAQTYDLIYAGVGKDYATETADLLRIATDAGIAGGTWLDVACGTGLHLQGLSGAFAVTGVDSSAEMLAVAKRRLPNVQFHEGDMRSFDLGERFDVVSCLFSAIGYMVTIPDLHRAIARLAAHVRPDGLLAVEAWFEPDAWMPGHLAHDVVERGGVTLIRASRSDRRDRVSTIDMHHLLMSPEGIEHFTEVHEMGLFTRAEYEGAFAAANLDVDRDPDFGTRRGLYLARAPG